MLSVLSRNDIQRIHSASLDILEDVGVMLDHEEVLRGLEKAGARVDYEKKTARIPEFLLKETLRKAPSRVSFLARDPKHDLRIGGGEHVYFTNGFGAVYVLDLEKAERRVATVADAKNFTLLSDALESVDYIIAHCIPQDVPGTLADRYLAFTMLTNTTKHCSLTTLSLEGAKDSIRMASVLVGSEEELRKKPGIINGGILPVSPLQYTHDSIARLIEFGTYSIPVTLCSGVISGATGPVTLAGTLAIVNAENLAGIVVGELFNPGTPILYGTMATIMDLKYGSYAYGSPEQALLNAASTEMAHYYDLPIYGTAGTIDSKLPDEQAAYECAISNLLAALSGTDIIHDGVYGILESAKTASYEQLLISHEIVSMVKRVRRGVQVTTEGLAADIIRSVGPGGSFLKEMSALVHTKKHLFGEHWQVCLTDRTGRSEWEQKGSKDIVQRARDRVQELLRTHKPDPVDKSIEEEMKKILEEAVHAHAKSS